MNVDDECKLFHDVDRKEFTFWQFLFFYRQSKLHIKVYNTLVFLEAIMLFIILGEGFKFTNIEPVPFVILLGVLAFLALKLERWLACCTIDTRLQKITKKMNIFGYQLHIFKNDLSEINGFFKIEYEMVYLLTFKNSIRKVCFQYTEKNPRSDVVTFFTRELSLELKEIIKK